MEYFELYKFIVVQIGNPFLAALLVGLILVAVQMARSLKSIDTKIAVMINRQEKQDAKIDGLHTEVAGLDTRVARLEGARNQA